MPAVRILTCILLLAAGTTSSCWANDDGKPPAVITREHALEIATLTFIRESHIPEFSVKSSESDQSDPKYWHFFFQGTGKFAFPGNNPSIWVDKKTGEVKVFGGE